MKFKLKNTPNAFLKIGGSIVLLLGIAEFTGIIDKSWTGGFMENYTHAALGAFMLIGGLTLSAKSQRVWTLVIGSVLALLITTTATLNYINETTGSMENLILQITLACFAFSAGIRRNTIATLTPANEKV